MATPWKHPTTGVFYLRRQIPERLRPAFDGKAVWKASLGTKNASEATILFLQANAALEQRFEEVRNRLKATGSPCPTARDRADELVAAYFQGPELKPGALEGDERLLLARLEVDRGLWNSTPTGCSHPAPLDDDRWWQMSMNAALFRDHPGRDPVLGHPPGSIWRWEDDRFRAGSKDGQLARIVEQIARHHALSEDELPQGIRDSVRAFLETVPVAVTKVRKRRASAGRLRTDMRMMQLFESWKDVMQPSLQTAHEYEGATRDFVDFVGDVTVEEITQNDLLDYRDDASALPASMPRADRSLPFCDRLAAHRHSQSRRVSPATLKKRVGAIQALLSFAKAQKWISRNEGRDIPILGYTKAKERRTFQEDDLQRLFSSTLFLKPSSWKPRRAVSDSTLYWLFLFGLTTCARLEEVGQAMVSDVKVDGPVTYIDIDDYPNTATSAEEAKSLKTATSRRLVPVHARLLELGFAEYVSSLREAQLTRLFPDLASNQFGKRTKEASRVANRIIDRCVSEDARLVFHSFRHGFKDLALEAGILERIVDQICGHAATTVGGKYGQGVRLSILNRELHRVDWSFLDWTALTAAIRPMSWSAVVADLAGRSSR